MDIITMQVQLSYQQNMTFEDTNNMLYPEFLQVYQTFVDIKKKEEEEMRRMEQKQQQQLNKLNSRILTNNISNLNFGGDL